MAQSAPLKDVNVYQGTCASGGTFTADYSVPTDYVARLVATALLTAASGGHLSATASLRAEVVDANLGGVLGSPGAVSASTNPLNSNTAGEASAHVQVSDASFIAAGGGTPPTLLWSRSGTNARVTLTNPGPTAANVTIWIEAYLVSST